MPAAVLFDLDRTLIDVQSFTDYAAALRDVEALVGSWDDVTVPATDWDRPTRRCMAALVALAGDPRWEDVSAAIERHEIAAVERSVAMPGLAPALRRTSRSLRAVVTLLPPDTAQRTLDRHAVGIRVIVGRNPSDRPKPAPDQVHAALDVLQVAPHAAVMLGDSMWDADAAEAAGVEFVGVGEGYFDAGIRSALDLPAALDLAGL